MVFFFNDTATTEIYTLSLHDALPIFRLENGNIVSQDGASWPLEDVVGLLEDAQIVGKGARGPNPTGMQRSEEHTSELQSRQYLVCRLLLEKKKTTSI